MQHPNSPSSNSNDQSPGRRSGLRSPEHYMQQLAPETLAVLSPEQQADVRRVIAEALPSPAPKVLDVRFGINLLFARYFVVFFMGKERRRNSRDRQLSWMNRWVNGAIAVALVLSMNLFVTLSLAILLYLIKSAVGIDLFPDSHLSDRFS